MREHEETDYWFRKNIKLQRERLGWTQNRLAEELSAAGLNEFQQTTVARMEKGTRVIKLGEAAVIAKTLGSTVEEMTVTPQAFNYVKDSILLGENGKRYYQDQLALISDLYNIFALSEDLNQRFWGDEEDAVRAEDLYIIHKGRLVGWGVENGLILFSTIIKQIARLSRDEKVNKNYLTKFLTGLAYSAELFSKDMFAFFDSEKIENFASWIDTNTSFSSDGLSVLDFDPLSSDAEEHTHDGE